MIIFVNRLWTLLLGGSSRLLTNLYKAYTRCKEYALNLSCLCTLKDARDLSAKITGSIGIRILKLHSKNLNFQQTNMRIQFAIGSKGELKERARDAVQSIITEIVPGAARSIGQDPDPGEEGGSFGCSVEKGKSSKKGPSFFFPVSPSS